MVKPFGFGKKEKLKSRKQIDKLFAEGKSFAVFPIRVTYNFSAADDEALAQIGVTVSKRNFKKAVDRNRIKRQLREAYRLQKTGLAEVLKQAGTKGHIFFMYTGRELMEFNQLKTAMHTCLQRLQKKISGPNEDIA